MVNKGGTDMWTRELLKRNAKEIILKEITGLVLVYHLYLQR